MILRISSNEFHTQNRPQDAWFTTTHWTVLLSVRSDDTKLAREALGDLCRTYWKPVNLYILRTTRNKSDAEDLTQQFFARFLEKEHYKLAERERGKFRSFLLTAVKHFLINEHERMSARKRGGGQAQISLDEEIEGEDRPRVEISDLRTAEYIYEQSWAIALLAKVRDRLQADYARTGKGERFEALEKFLPGEENELTYAELSARFGIPEGTLKSDVHRLKNRYAELLREEIGRTVSTPNEVEEELRALITVLGQLTQSH
jgi:RNA polymerase sigma factor (sigma-70 family)